MTAEIVQFRASDRVKVPAAAAPVSDDVAHLQDCLDVARTLRRKLVNVQPPDGLFGDALMHAENVEGYLNALVEAREEEAS